MGRILLFLFAVLALVKPCVVADTKDRKDRAHELNLKKLECNPGSIAPGIGQADSVTTVRGVRT